MEKVSRAKGTQTFLTNYIFREPINTQACRESKGIEYPENEDEAHVLLEEKTNYDGSSDLRGIVTFR